LTPPASGRAQLFHSTGVEFPVNDNIPENDALWHLLGRSTRPEPSPFFARNVLREIRQTRRPPPPPWRTALQRWLAPAAYATLTLAFLLTLPRPGPETPIATTPTHLAEFEDLLTTLEFTPAHLAGLP
jgi:hypothetical protein